MTMTMTVSPYRIVPLNGQDGMFVSNVSVMQAISHEIENVVIENDLPVDFYAGFQRFSNFAHQQERYRQLARTCRRVYIWGVPDVPPPAIDNIEYIPLDEDDETAREWFVVADSPDFFTALIAQEATYERDAPAYERQFQGIWTHDTDLVSQATWMTSQMLEIPYNPIMERNYEQQSHYMAQIYTRLMQRREQYFLEQMRSQNRATVLQAGIASCASPMLLLDSDKTIIAVSQSACDILHIQQHMLLGKPLTSCADGLFAQRDPTEVKPPMIALLNISEKEVLAVTSKPITDATQQPAGWVISLHHANHQRKRYQRRTLPITPIVEGYCMRLQQQLGGLSQLVDTPDAHQQAIDEARQMVNQLSKRVQRLSLLQSLEAQGETDQEAIHVSTLVQPVFQKARAALARQGIALELAIDADIAPLCCNINQVRLALHELIDNLAAHASRATTAHIRVSQRHGYIYMSVEDNGCGLAWEAQQGIFEPFSRTQQPSYGSEHIGIGLAIARSVAAAHHGHLRIDSRHTNAGCTVTLMLPMQH